MAWFSPDPEIPWVNFGFVAGQPLSGSLVPWRASDCYTAVRQRDPFARLDPIQIGVLHSSPEQYSEAAVDCLDARQITLSASTENFYGIDPDYRFGRAGVWWRRILGSQPRSLVIDCYLRIP
jgi:hypothetical protein